MNSPAALREQLHSLPYAIAYDTYVNTNWEIFTINPDGSSPRNLTQTPNLHEHSPQISPDGTKIAFVADEGEGRDTIRSLCVMDLDGKNRKKLVQYAREPFWTRDPNRIGFLPQEYPKFNVIDYYTQGMSFYDLVTGKIEPNPNTNIYHIYCPSLAPNGKWYIATAHAGMGFSHDNIAIAVRGEKVVNLNLNGCRPWLSPGGKQIAWGNGDYEIAVAPINLDSDNPTAGPPRLQITSTNRLTQPDWSPDARFLCFCWGPPGMGDPDKPNTFLGAAGLMGVYAADWNLCVVSAERTGTINLDQATDADFALLTTNGLSNKEPAWFRKPSAIPKGLQSLSPGLPSLRGYPGLASKQVPNPEGVALKPERLAENTGARTPTSASSKPEGLPESSRRSQTSGTRLANTLHPGGVPEASSKSQSLSLTPNFSWVWAATLVPETVSTVSWKILPP